MKRLEHETIVDEFARETEINTLSKYLVARKKQVRLFHLRKPLWKRQLFAQAGAKAAAKMTKERA